MAVRTWVGRFTIVEGHAQEEGPWLGSLIRQHPDDEPDELYVLVEPATAGSEEYTSQLVHVIARLYARDPLSLTGALTRSLRAAHEHLRDWNRKSLKEHRVAAGASCLTLRGTEAYLAQAGPSLAYVFRDGEVTRYQAERMDFEASLGIAESFEPQLKRITLEPGDLVLVASTQLDAVVPPEHIKRLLAQGADDALAELYLLCRDRPNFALVLLSCFEEATDAPPEFLTREVAAAPIDGPAADNPASAQGELVAAPAGGGPEPAQASLAGSLGDFDLPQRPIQEQVKEITQSTAPPPAAGVRIRGDSATPRYRRSTGSMPVPRIQVPRLLVFGIAAVLALGLLAWWQLPRSVQESREDRFVSLLADARASNARAQATGDTGLKRQLLNGAQMSLNDAGKIHGDNGELVALKADVAASLAALNAVFEIRDFQTVADLAQQVTGSLAVTDSVVGGDHAYFLDAEGGRVLRLALAGGTPPETVLTEGDATGALTVARPSQLAWSEETDSLIVLDDRRQTFAYFPDRGTLPLAVRGSDAWGSLNGATAAGGNLYLLDVEGDQVWRYLPGQGGFDSERTGLLDAAELENATELAVGQDVYLLDNELGVRRFTGKEETAFPLSGIDTPLLSPASLSVLPGSNRLVVADRGNKRIVVASPEGAFLRQIVSPAFTDLRAVSVDEGNGILYVLNGDTLLRAPFPP